MNVVRRWSHLHFPRQERPYNTATTSSDSACLSPVDKKFDLRRMSSHENCTFSGSGRGPRAALSYTSPSKLLLVLLLLQYAFFGTNFDASAEQIRDGEAASRSSNDGVVEALQRPAPSSSGQHPPVELNKSPRRGPASTSTSSPVLDSSSLVPSEMNKTPPASTSSVLEVELQEKEGKNKKLLVDTAKQKQSEQQQQHRTGEAEAKIDRAKMLNQHEATARRVNFNERKQMLAAASTKAGTAQQEEKSTRKKSEQQQQKVQNQGKHQAEKQKTTAHEGRSMNREQKSRAKQQLAEVARAKQMGKQAEGRARAKQMAKQGARRDSWFDEYVDDAYNHIGDAWKETGEKAWEHAMDAANDHWHLDENVPGYDQVTDWWNNDVWTIDNAHDLSIANMFLSGSGRMQDFFVMLVWHDCECD